MPIGYFHHLSVTHKTTKRKIKMERKHTLLNTILMVKYRTTIFAAAVSRAMKTII